MPIYQNATVTDAKIEVGNYTISVAATAGTTAGGTWVNLGAGMVKSFQYSPEFYTSQSGNSPDPIEGVTRETATLEIDLIEYDGSAFSVLSGGLQSGTTGSIIVGGVTGGSAMSGRGIKLVNTRIKANGSTQTTTIVLNKCYLPNGWSVAYKSDNDADPVAVYSFSVLAKQHATAGNVYTKTVS